MARLAKAFIISAVLCHSCLSSDIADDSCSDETSLMQLKSDIHSGRDAQELVVSDDKDETCGDLINKGAYFAVNVGVGTPMKHTEPQVFELVADTGSDSVIVTSCICVKNRVGCDPKDRCFTGQNRSSSFAVLERPVNKSSNLTAPLGVAMTFGSGTVMTIIASDVVKVAGKTTKMDEGLLLMVDRRMLQIQGKFQGILGLGPPEIKNKSVTLFTESKKNKSEENANKGNYAPKLFLQQAGVERYSLCFNDGGTPGAMRLNVPKFEKPLPTIGNFHWGLGLHGISVGSETTDAFVCNPDEMKEGQTTPCGVIPDSGTTLLMGPEDHITKMFGALCDDWDRCKKAHSTGHLNNVSKSHAFQKLLYDCDDWKTKDSGIGEVPSVFLNVGEKGNQQKLELTSWSYIVETTQEQYKHHTRYLFGIIPIEVPVPTGKFKKVCVPSFGVQHYNTKQNGPVWILGHPLFYQYTVGYSLGAHSEASHAKGQMEMSFTKQKCGLCNATKASLLSSHDEVVPSSHKRARPMRTLHDPPLVPQRDLSLPL